MKLNSDSKVHDDPETIRQEIEQLIDKTKRSPWLGVPIGKCTEAVQYYLAPRIAQNPEWFV